MQRKISIASDSSTASFSDTSSVSNISFSRRNSIYGPPYGILKSPSSGANIDNDYMGYSGRGRSRSSRRVRVMDVPDYNFRRPSNERVSTVSDVTRKISTTMGWRTIRISEVVTQAKCLCSQYIRARLKRTGLMHKKAGLQRIQSVANLEGGWEVCEVFPRVLGIGLELERSHPKIYNSVARQLSLSLTSDKVVRAIPVAVATHVFKDGITWGHIISLLAVTAGLASDCVKQGHPEYVRILVDAMGVITERHTAPWIIAQGGWSAILSWSQAPEVDGSTLKILVLSVIGLILTCFVFTGVIKIVTQYVT